MRGKRGSGADLDAPRRPRPPPRTRHTHRNEPRRSTQPLQNQREQARTRGAPRRTRTHADAGSSWSRLAVGRFDGDGRDDLAVFTVESENATANAVAVLGAVPDSGGQVQVLDTITLDAGRSLAAVLPVDHDHDGADDLVLLTDPTATDDGYGDKHLDLWDNDGTGLFPSRTSRYAIGSHIDRSYPSSLVSGDFNQDGQLEIAMAGFNDGYIEINALDANGVWGPADLYRSSARFSVPTSLVADDLNGDGKDDLAFLEQQGSLLPLHGDQVHLLLSDPDTNQLQPELRAVPLGGAGYRLLAGAFTGHTATPGYHAPMGNPTRLVHEADGSWTETTVDGPATITYAYDDAGNPITVTDLDGHAIAPTIDAMSHPVASVAWPPSAKPDSVAGAMTSGRVR